MAFYIDSADRTVVEELWPTGAFWGVTTNPTILARAGLAQADLPDLYRSLRDLGVETFYAQVVGTDTDEMLSSARSLLALGPLVVKVPASRCCSPRSTTRCRRCWRATWGCRVWRRTSAG